MIIVVVFPCVATRWRRCGRRAVIHWRLWRNCWVKARTS